MADTTSFYKPSSSGRGTTRRRLQHTIIDKLLIIMNMVDTARAKEHAVSANEHSAKAHKHTTSAHEHSHK